LTGRAADDAVKAAGRDVVVFDSLVPDDVWAFGDAESFGCESSIEDACAGEEGEDEFHGRSVIAQA
jgi:hypothetical protein